MIFLFLYKEIYLDFLIYHPIFSSYDRLNFFQQLYYNKPKRLLIKNNFVRIFFLDVLF